MKIISTKNYNSLMGKVFGCLMIVGFLMIQNPVGLFAQTAGFIYKPATGDGTTVLDPSETGNVLTSGINFHALPQIDVEPLGDPRTGPSGGHTDLVSNSDGSESGAYMSYDPINEVIIFRVRLGGQSTASKGYTFVFNTSFELFGPKASNFSSTNPGFQFEVVLETNKGIGIYKLDENGVVASKKIEPVDAYIQKSISDEVYGSGSTGFFYDFYIPRDEIDGWEGLVLDPSSTGFKVVAATITRAQSGITGTISDVNGINDDNYKSSTSALVNIIENSPEVTLNDLSNFSNVKPRAPSIFGPLSAGTAQTIEGSSLENGATVKLFINDVEFGTTASVSGNAWSTSNVDLNTDDKVYAVVEKGGEDSDPSTTLIVGTITQCTETPVGVMKDGNNLSGRIPGIEGVLWEITGNNESSYNVSTNLVLRVYTSDGALYKITSNSYVKNTEQTIISSWDSTDNSFVIYGSGNEYNSSNLGINYYVTAQLEGQCESGGGTGTDEGTSSQTPAPTITTNPILTTTTTISGTAVANAQVFLYQNGVQIGVAAIANESGIWTVDVSAETLVNNSFITAKAQSTGEIISDASDPVPVGTEIQKTTRPIITGDYIQEASATITGFIYEPDGTSINIFLDEVFIGNTTSDIYGEWELTGVDLTGASTITARATADGKTQSDFSDPVFISSALSGMPEIFGGADDKLVSDSFDPVPTTIDGTVGNINIYTLRGNEQTLLGSGSTAPTSIDIIDSYNAYAGDELFASNTVAGAPDSSISNFVLVTAPEGAYNIFLQSNSTSTLSSGGGQSVDFEFLVLNSTFSEVDGATVNFSIVDGSGSLSAVSGTSSAGGLINVTYTTAAGDDDSIIRIRADVLNSDSEIDGSDYASIKVLDAEASPPSQVTLSSPANESSAVSLTPQISWQAASGADSYSLQVSESSDFTTQVVNIPEIAGLSYDIADSLSPVTDYYWRVKATNENGTSDWSSVWSFTTTSGPATQILVESAADGSGYVIAEQTISSGNTITAYAIARDASGNFVELITDASWSLLNKTDAIAYGDLVDNEDGSATFTGNLIGSANISAASGDLTQTSSGTLTITAGEAANLVIVTQPKGGASGYELAVKPVVEIRDAAGNTISDDNATQVQVNISSGNNGQLSGTFTKTASTGTVTFSDLGLSGLVSENYRLSFTDVTDGRIEDALLNSATSNEINVTVGAATTMIVSTEPVNSVAGTAIGGPPAVTITDDSGNPISGVAVSVSLNKSGFTSGEISQTTDANGTASFNDLIITKADSSYLLTFDAEAVGVENVTSNSFNISPAAADPSTSTITAADENIIANGSSLTGITVQLQDVYGNNFTSGGDEVALNSSAGTLGVVTDKGNGTYTTELTASTTVETASITGTVNGVAINDVESVEFTAGPLAAFRIEKQGGGEITDHIAGEQFDIQITAVDANENLITTFAGKVSLNLNKSEFNAGGGETAAFENGILENHTIQIYTADTNYQITAENAGVGSESGTTNNFAVNAVGTAKLAFVQQPSNAVAGDTISPAVKVQLLDAYNNEVKQKDVAVSLTISEGATLNGTKTISTDANGVAAFTDLHVIEPAEEYSLTAASGLLNTDESDAFNITRRPITVTAKTATKVYWEDEPVLTYEISAGTLIPTVNLNGALQRASGEDVGSYQINAGTITNGNNPSYDITYAGAEFEVTRRNLILSNFTASDKAYDGSTAASGIAFDDDRIATDELEFTFSAAFADAGAGTDKTVNITGITISGGADKDNYSLVTTAGTATASITTSNVTISAWPAVSAITYGETLTQSTLSGGEASTAGSFVFKDAAIQPTAAGSYSVEVLFIPDDTDNDTVEGNVDVTVNKKALTITTADQNKTYDGEVFTAFTVTYNGFITGEDESDLGGTLSFGGTSAGATDAGTYTITPSGLTSDNYAITFEEGALDIAKRDLTLTYFTAANKTFDGMTTAPGIAFDDNRITDDELEFSYSAAFADAAAGTDKTVNITGITISDGADKDNYSLVTTYGTATASITSSNVTISAWPAASDITYGEALAQSTLSGGTASTAGSFAFKDHTIQPTAAGTYSADVIFTPDDSDNFDTVEGKVDVTVNKKTVSVAGAVAGDKTYDGTKNAQISNATLVGVVGDDEVELQNVNGGSFALAEVGTDIEVSTAMSLSGAEIGNYTLMQPTGLSASISKRPIEITVQDAERTADNYHLNFNFANFSAQLAASDVISDITGGTGSDDDVIFTLANTDSNSVTGVYNDEISIDIESLDGAKASNYEFTIVAGDLIITPAGLSGFLVEGVKNPTKAGAVNTVHVSAIDSEGNVKTDFTGTITFSSSDSLADLPESYTFTIDDKGKVEIINEVTFYIAGTHWIGVESVGITGLQENIEVLPSAVSINNSRTKLEVLSNNVTADGSETAKVQVHLLDAYNNAVPDKVVTFAGTGNAVIADPAGVTNALGTYTVSITNTKAESVNLTAQFDSDGDGNPDTAVANGNPAVINFNVGAISAANSLISVSSPHTADGEDASAITIQVRDANENNISDLTAQDFELTIGENALLSDFFNNGNGIYTYKLTNTTAETVTLDVLVDEVVLNNEPNIVFEAGAVSPEKSIVNATSPHTADGVDASIITIQLKDEFSNIISGLADIIEISTTGNATIRDISETEVSGTYTAALVNTTAEKTQISVEVDTVELATSPNVDFVSGAISATRSKVTANPDTVIADGISKSIITIDLMDGEGNVVSGEAANVSLAGLENAEASAIAETETSGRYQVEITNTKKEKLEILVNIGGTTLEETATIVFVPGAISAENSLVEAIPDTLPVDSVSIILVTLRDANKNLISNHETDIVLNLSGDATVINDFSESGAETGIYEAFITNSTVEKITVTVSEKGNSEIGEADVEFTAGSAAKLVIVSGNNQSDVVADTLKNPLVVKVTDEKANPVAGVDVIFEIGSFSVDSIGAELLNISSKTNAQGLASATYKLGTKAGSYEVDARSEGLAGVTFAAEAIHGEAVADNSTAIVPDGKVAERTDITINVQDIFGNPVVGEAKLLSLNLSGVNTGAELTEIIDNGDGSYSTSYIPLKPGEDKFDISLNSAPLIGNPFNSTVVAGDLKSIIVVSGGNQSQEVTTVLEDSLVVQVNDVNDLPIPGKTVEFIVAEAPENAEMQKLSLKSVVSDENGLAKVEFRLGNKSGKYKVTAEVDTNAVDIIAYASAGPVKNFALVGGSDQEQPTLSVLEDSLTVSLFDQYDNPIPNEPIAFRLFTKPDFSEGSQLSPDTVFTNDLGVAKSAFKLGDTGGLYQVTAKAYQLPIDSLMFNAFAIDKRTNPTVIDTVNTVVFNGDMSTYMYAEPDATLDSLESYTFEIWVLPKSVDNYFELFSKENEEENSKQFKIIGEQNSINATIYLDQNNSVTLTADDVFEIDEAEGNLQKATSVDPLLYKWTHIAFSVDNENKKVNLYKNGFRVAASDFEGEVNKGNAQLEFGRGFDGEIHEIRVWDVARSRNQIQSQMTQILSGNEESLVLYHTFDDDGNIADDLTDNGNDLHLGNGVARNFSIRGIPNIEMFENEEYIMAFKAVDEYGSKLNTVINKLPANGRLYHVKNGSEIGSEIINVPAILSDPLNRTLYKPHPNYNGKDSVQYSLVDELGNTAGANRMITIYPVYKPPTQFTQLLPANHDSIHVAVRGDVEKTEVKFEWEPSESFGDANITYILSIWDDEGQSQTYDEISENSFSLRLDKSILKYDKKYNWRVSATDGVDTTLSVSDMDFIVARELPMVYQLHQNYPNPFNPNTKIEYWVPVTSKVRIEIYDVLGRQVQTLIDEDNVKSGTYQVTWNARNLASGVYFYRMTSQGINGSRFVKLKQMTLIK